MVNINTGRIYNPPGRNQAIISLNMELLSESQFKPGNTVHIIYETGKITIVRPDMLEFNIKASKDIGKIGSQDDDKALCKISLVENIDIDIPKKGGFKWGNTMCTSMNPIGNRRIKMDYTDIGRCVWILDGRGILASGHTGSLLEFAGILYEQNKNDFDKLLGIHGPRTARYVARDKSSFTNNGQFAMQIKDSGLYIETCLCANDCIELAYAMLEVLGYDLDRLKVEKI